MLRIPIYKPFLIGNESKYVNECLVSNWISSLGKFVGEFEVNFAKYLNVREAIAVSNGTVALHLALMALDIKEGDEVIVPTFTYIASVNAIKYVGAEPVFCDSNVDTWQIDPDEIIRKITKKTKAIMVVHLYGFMCNMTRITQIAKLNNLKIIEDSSEAFGSKYNDKLAGNFGDIATFSLFGNKTITTGEGGMIVTNKQELASKIRTLKNQGIRSDKEYDHEVIGYNYRMTNICAAIGKAQLEKIDTILSKKRALAFNFFEELKDYPIYFIKEDEKIYNSFWMITGKVANKKVRDSLRIYLSEQGIETRGAFPPVTTFPFYKMDEVCFPIANRLSQCGLNLPSYPGLSDEEVKFICDSIKKFFNKR